jgi:hypothetical protein
MVEVFHPQCGELQPYRETENTSSEKSVYLKTALAGYLSRRQFTRTP